MSRKALQGFVSEHDFGLQLEQEMFNGHPAAPKCILKAECGLVLKTQLTALGNCPSIKCFESHFFVYLFVFSPQLPKKTQETSLWCVLPCTGGWQLVQLSAEIEIHF